MHPDALASMLRLRSTTRAHRTVQGYAPDLSPQDVALALALAHAPPLAVHAFRWRFLQDASGVPALAEHLRGMVRHLAAHGKLPKSVDPERLVELALLEECWPPKDRTVPRRARCADCSPSTWRRRWMRPHSVLASRLDCLVDDAWRMVRLRVVA